MVRDCRSWRKGAAVAVAMAVLPLTGLAAQAQGFMRSPTIRVDSRVSIAPRINPNIAGRVGANAVGRVGTTVVARTTPTTPHVTTVSRIGAVSRLATGGALPYARYSPNLYPACDYAYRGRDGECYDRPVALIEGGSGKGKSGKGGAGGGRDNGAQSALNLRAEPKEFVAEIDGALTDAQADELARRHGLTRIASQNFPLIGATIGLFRITDNRPTDLVSREFAGDGSVRSVQPNFRYVLQDQKAAASEGDAAQYALAQLRLPQAHTLARGMNVTIAVIDSGIDASHPELANTVADTFDALGSKEGPHVHGTGIAGAIAAHAKLMGSAPEVRILAIRAFGAAASGAQSTSYVILKGLDYAAQHGAQIVNMSFAGPKDALIERGVAATAAKGIVMIAAAGNAGAKSPPLYPAANPNVIAVSGTDAKDRLFAASNRGSYIALAAPGADILLPAPDGKYQMTSGTSFSAAFVSGIAALVLERNPALKPNEVRAILTNTARDLGAPGRDDLFGAGEADAFAAVTAAAAASAVPVAAASDKSEPKAADGNNTSVSRALNDVAPSMASDKSAAKTPIAPPRSDFRR
ncbi:S8 family serine peptidase [Bradyrhizobium erythrophlei]|uniref:S8 family serine peptidase n=1 Tax=Bradyrhizobium erythrophlei TaxID=1437360 RepID=UPI0035ECAB55